MSFDIMIPPTGGMLYRPDEVRMRLRKDGNRLALVVKVGRDICTRLAWTRGSRIQMGLGAKSTPDWGRLAIWCAPDGHYRLRGDRACQTLMVETRARHACLVSAETVMTLADILLAEDGRLVVRIPTDLLKINERSTRAIA